jgi:CHAT domain-containing protein
MRKLTGLAAALAMLLLLPLLAQEPVPSAAAIKEALSGKDIKTANRLFLERATYLIRNKQLDSLSSETELAGEIGFAQNELPGAVQHIQRFIDTAVALSGVPELRVNMHVKAADYFNTLGQTRLALDQYQTALISERRLQLPDTLEVARLHYNIGTCLQRMGMLPEAAAEYRLSNAIRTTNTRTTPEDLYLTQNAMGTVMWYALKYDSASLFFNQALVTLNKMPATPQNKYYRPSIIQNNLAAIYGAEGNTTAAIQTMQSSIQNMYSYVRDSTISQKKASVKSGIYEGIDNLAGLYRELGDYKRASDLLLYSYEQKKNELPEGHSGIFISEILLGQLYNNMNEFEKAEAFIKSGLAKLKAAEGDFLYWEGDAYYTLAMVAASKGEPEAASMYYAASEKAYAAGYGDEYDNIYLDFLSNAAKFYAANNQFAKAKAILDKTLGYVRSVQEGPSQAMFNQLLNMGEIYYLAHRYPETLKYSNEAIDVLNQYLARASTPIDSARMQFKIPRAILINQQAMYAMQPVHDTAFLNRVSRRMQDAINILEQRKGLIDDAESVQVLIAENAAIYGFARQVEMELYKLTGTAQHLDKYVDLYESALYSRIRNRLNKAAAIRFANLPPAIQTEEEKLKAEIAVSLQLAGADSLQIDRYLKAAQAWQSYLDKIRVQYPGYYQMRYASQERGLTSIRATLPAGVTVVRYYADGDSLRALVIDKDQQVLTDLQAPALSKRIATLVQLNTSDTLPGKLLHELYQDLWQPIAAHIRNRQVVIIPDAVLYSLSFEMLTPAPLQQYAQLAQGSLLAKHVISYQYSLMLVGRQAAEEKALQKNYIAFVPGFDDKDKQAYRQRVGDSVRVDRQYLSLLPQPSTVKLARRLGRLLGGDAYTDHSSTLTRFRSQAAGHKILYIGTHAEYNNQMPDRSRLIFSKEPERPDSNSLYLADIYGCNVASDLAVLTACESGRPGYQDGEGMVSLAHAFNYAGSKSIVMGLWGIDERSSSQITEAMIAHMRKGMAANEALQKAKLDYLQASKGRTLAPAYWAGLVLMGDAVTVDFTSSLSTWWWIAGIMILLIVGGYWMWKR